MTRLLVSVRSVAEAREALDAGVDLVDLKEPRRGSLGAVDWEVAAEVAAQAAARSPVSMALGELMDGCAPTDRKVPRGVAYVKLGMAGAAIEADWPRRWSDALALLPAFATPVAVAYADWRDAQAPRPSDVLAEGRKLGCGAFLVDTWRKSAGGLLDCVTFRELAELLQGARAGGMLGVVGGSLTWETVAPVLELAPDYVAVRGAVCRGSRLAALDGKLVERWVERVHGSRRRAEGGMRKDDPG
ncbi:MAG TPA: (5-formylfuran-3-yl)methyl phosphate synthase [Pirellulales bacterium]|nr:(5-formylfuran-3-yl)methyl phosphate synthase [Pirellulales bacterium]